MAETSPQSNAAAEEPVIAVPPKRRKRRLVLMLALPVLLLIGGAVYWYLSQGKVSTDNAYLKQDKVAVSAEVNGTVVDVMVHENENVRAGDVLFRIDPEPFRLQLRQADASIAAAEANVAALSNASALSGADIAAARENIAFAQATLDRQAALWKRGFTTKASYDAARHAVAQARDGLKLAEAKQREAAAKLSTGAQVPGINPQIAAGRAQRAAAELALRRTEVRAPISGRVTQASRLQRGQAAITGLPMATIVSEQSSYIEANFKETDLAEMRPGQPAQVTFDAYPGLKLKARVSSIGAGTGSEFSVLPAQNATGNWVKVTQRVPVRITLDEPSPRPLIAGLSTHVTVYIDGRRR